MPGLRYPEPPATAPNGSSYTFFHDAQQTPSAGKDVGATWDSVDIDSVHIAAAETSVPFVPNKHKACRPPQFHAAWMKGKSGAAAAHAFTSEGHNMSAPVPGYGGNDSDDLATMVHDFIESGSPAFLDASDTDIATPDIIQLRSTLEALTTSYGGIEADLVAVVRKLVLAIDVDNDLICNSGGADCMGGCIKRLVVNQLRAAGYDAAVCKSKWESPRRVLGGSSVHAGEYEYIDVKVHWNQSVERLLVDVDFQDQFVLARATPTYLSSLKLLPTVFVGTTMRLEQILQTMAEAVKVSLQHNSMPLPPWRTLDFMVSKWLSPHERVVDKRLSTWTSWPSCTAVHRPVGFDNPSLGRKGRLPSTPETRPCDVQLRRIKDSLLSEVTVNIPGRSRSTRHYSKPRAKRTIL